jgi:hypothetical protein
MDAAPIKVGDIVKLRFGGGMGVLNPTYPFEQGVDINANAWTVKSIHGNSIEVVSATLTGGTFTLYVEPREIMGQPIPSLYLALATLF